MFTPIPSQLTRRILFRQMTPSAATTYELTYFDTAGRAGHIRPMLHAAGLEFTDYRFPFQEWGNIQPTTPLGVVPTLKIGNTTYCQSNVSLSSSSYCIR
jgi:hypothetical protein